MGKNILLTGGTGLLGNHLTEALLKKGHTVSHLSRSEGKDPRVKTYLWDVNNNKIDPGCIKDVDTIVHMAGAGIAEKRWTDERKKEIIESRTKSIGLIYGLLRDKEHTVTSVVSASATGYYSDRGNTLLTEDSEPANDFLGNCCIQWEEAVDAGEALGLRVLKLRTGVVLDKEGGALKVLSMPIKFFLGSPIGSGRQWVPWIHWHDVVAMYIYGIEHKSMKGVFNMVSPYPVTNKQLSKGVARQLHRFLWPIHVPGIALKLALGEMSTIVLGSAKVSAEKIELKGFKIAYPRMEQALKEIYGQ